jgi:phosphoglycolate phosphatase
VFHGTKDPLANTDEIRAGAERLALPLHLVQDANHSLETGDVQTDLKIQQFVMGELERVLFSMR